MSEKC